MTEASAIPPLVLEFEIGASSQHAFETWVERPTLWWPASHTLSGDPASITFEPRSGGRIVEVDRLGAELPWGTIRVWEPPHRLEFTWHHVFPVDQATHVAISFMPAADPAVGRTIVRIEQTGWDALGDDGPPRRDGNTRGWTAVLGAYIDHLQGATP